MLTLEEKQGQKPSYKVRYCFRDIYNDTVPLVAVGSPWILSAFLDDAHPVGKDSLTPL